MLVVLGTVAALVASIVTIGSTLNDRDTDDTVMLVPTTDPSPKGAVDETPPPDDTPTGVPSAASTAGPSPAPAGTVDADDARDDQPSRPDRAESEDPRSPDPSPRPRATHPGESPSNPPAEPGPEPTLPDDPGPSPPAPTPSQDPEFACDAEATVKNSAPLGLGFTASVRITNTSEITISSWTSAFTLPGGYRLTAAKNAEIVKADKHAVVRGTGEAAVIGAGKNVTFEITANGVGRPDEPSNISVNGVACD